MKAPIETYRYFVLHTQFKFERQYRRPPQWILWQDVRSVKPVKAVAILVACDGDNDEMILMDLSRIEGREQLISLYQSNLPKVVHDLKHELFAAWSLGFEPDLSDAFDLRAAVATLDLGKQSRMHDYTEGDFEDDPVKIVKAQNKAADDWSHKTSLEGVYRDRLGAPKGPQRPAEAPYPQKNNITNGKGAIDFAQLDFNAEIDAAQKIQKLYTIVHLEAAQRELLEYLSVVEFPFVQAMARCEWNGVLLDDNAREQLEVECRNILGVSEAELRSFGIANPSRETFLNFIERLGLGHHFTDRTRRGQVSLKRAVLKKYASVHPAVGDYREYVDSRRLLRLWGLKRAIGLDGRLHARFIHNGTVTGRTSVIEPAVGNMEHRVRSLIVAAPGCKLIEYDYDSFELAVAAARFNQDDLLDLYNSTKDLYQEIASRYFVDLPVKKVKIMLLAFINGVTARGIAKELNCTHEEAQVRLDRIAQAFPNLVQGISQYVAQAIEMGHAPIFGGLYRHIQVDGFPKNALRRSLANTPVQGAAAAIFKLAVTRMNSDFHEKNIKIVLLKHDSVLLECPNNQVEFVNELVPARMQEAGLYFFPNLRLKANSIHGVIDRWL